MGDVDTSFTRQGVSLFMSLRNDRSYKYQTSTRRPHLYDVLTVLFYGEYLRTLQDIRAEA